MRLVYLQTDTALGPMLLAAGSEGLAGAWFAAQQHFPEMRAWQPSARHPVLQEAAEQLRAYFAGRRQSFDLPLHPCWGSAFQRAVWCALKRIPLGQTTHYGDLARQLQRPRAARAVGAAVGRNPWSVIVPCHRVVGANGSLCGYAGGMARKLALLRFEGIQR